MFLRHLPVSIVLIGLVACAPVPRMHEDCADPGTRAKSQFQVRMEVYEDSLGDHHLLVVEPSQCTMNPTEKGCVTVAKDDVGEITFHLKDGRGQNCQGTGTVKWRLQGVQMSMQAKDTSGSVTDEVKCDFGTDDQGHVLNPEFPGGPRMKILDRNNEAYEVYYTVSAVSCDTGEVISTDPWVENKGSS